MTTLTTISNARALLRAAQANAAVARSATVAGDATRSVPVVDLNTQKGIAGALGGSGAAAAAHSVATAQAEITNASTDLHRVVGNYLGEDPTADVARLDARFPIALFPVRLETRFNQKSELQIRVYPDEILADAHDPALTAEEQQMGVRYWAESSTLGEASAWQHLLGLYSATRAAWIVKSTDPVATTTPILRPNAWPRAVDAPLLPDRWVAIAYRGGVQIGRAVSGVVVEPLALTLSADAPTSSNVDISGGLGLKIDPAIEWTVQYDAAEKVGMAFRMTLNATDVAAGIDRLLVFGVKSSIAPAEGAAAVQAIFDAQHYSAGMAFVAQGTPTNDSRDAPSGYPPADPNGTTSFAIERVASLATPGSDGAKFTSALGLSAEVVAHVQGADRTEQSSAAAMSRVLFPATWGYYLNTMMAPNVSSETVDALEAYMFNHVRARGPLPAFRVGVAPYGLLPVSSLSRWKGGDIEGVVESHLPQLLRTARSIWEAQVGAVPHVGRTADADADLVDVMSMDASARAFRMRKMLGETAQWNLLGFLGIDWTAWSDAQKAIGAAVLASVGVPLGAAPILRAVFADTAPKFRYGFASDNPISETDALDPNYITWVRQASHDALFAEAFPSIPNALLYRLIRYALQQANWSVAKSILLMAGRATPADLLEHELIGIVPGTEQRLTPWQHLAQPIPGVTHGMSLGQYLSPIKAGEPLRAVPPTLKSYRDALGVLENLPTAELDRLTSETLDLAAWRLDAWITSLYSNRLDAMRMALPTGVHVGAFAWVENLRPDPAPSDPRVSEGGFVHGPSMTHAAAAAVLLNGYLTGIGSTSTPGADPPYAIALTSARVRSARFVLDSVREGQALGAVFGYQVERALHERLAELLIDPLRALYPIVANKAFDSGLPAESIAARNVVDGLQLRTAWRSGTIPWGTLGVPASGVLRTTLETVLGELDDTVDAVADLLLAESVFQLVRGSTAGTAATLDSLAQGVRPPDPGIAHPLRGGTDLTHRVAVVIGGAPIALPSGWPTTLTPRAAAEPRLDAWVGVLLGNPSTVRCQVIYNSVTQDVQLDALALRPLDFLTFAKGSEASQLSELERRIVFSALGDVPSADGLPATVRYTRVPSWDRATVRTVPEFLEVARAIAAVIGSARVMRPEDVVRPGDASGAVGTGLASTEALDRAVAAETALGITIGSLDAALNTVPQGANPTAAQLAVLRTVLREAASFGIDGAYPVPGAGLDVGGIMPTVIAQATGSLFEMKRRKAVAAAAHLPTTPVPTDAQRVAAASEIAKAVFGRDFVTVVGFTPPNAATMAAALAAAPTLVADTNEPVRWLQQVSRVRDPLARWRAMRLLCEATGTLPLTLDVVQLPVAAGSRWGALPFATPADRVSGRLSFVLERVAAPTATDPWYGLVIDEWVELIPSETESTGLTFQYDNPCSEAAQAVLLAVPPVTSAESWDFDSLVDILNETLDMAKMRAVDASQLGELGQLLPAIFFAGNENDDTIAAKWAGAMRQETTIKFSDGGLN